MRQCPQAAQVSSTCAQTCSENVCCAMSAISHLMLQFHSFLHPSSNSRIPPISYYATIPVVWWTLCLRWNVCAEIFRTGVHSLSILPACQHIMTQGGSTFLSHKTMLVSVHARTATPTVKLLGVHCPAPHAAPCTPVCWLYLRQRFGSSAIRTAVLGPKFPSIPHWGHRVCPESTAPVPQTCGEELGKRVQQWKWARDLDGWSWQNDIVTMAPCNNQDGFTRSWQNCMGLAARSWAFIPLVSGGLISVPWSRIPPQISVLQALRNNVLHTSSW